MVDTERVIARTLRAVANPLVIVESPAKAKTIAGYLGSDYVVDSSVGHIRDLPQNAADVPAAYKGEPWARLGVDTDNDFKPLYVVNKGKKDVVANLRKKMKAASELYLATDEDREGEAIAWHLLEVLNPPSGMPVRRMVFHEITPEAIQRAIDEPREIDRRLVDAQEARRILDRLYGYEVSPVLWKKVQTGLSAGRVQSVATRIVVERERARMRFTVASYWDLDGVFAGGTPQTDFGATLVAVDGARLATGKDFDENGTLQGEVALLDEAGARGLADALDGADVAVRSVESKPYTRKPYAPFMTSTLQQEAGRKLRFGSARTMAVAQRLYENGYITYMRTDSTTLSETAVGAARAQILEKYGAGLPARRPPAVHPQGQERPGGPRGHPARRRPLPAPRRGPGRAAGRRVPPVRAGVAAHRRLADDRRPRTVGPGPPGRHAVRRTGRRVLRHRQDHPPPRLPAGLRGGLRRPRGRPRGPGADPARHGRGRPGRGAQHRGQGSRDPAAGPLHRGLAGTAHGGARRRAAVDLRLDHRHHPGPGLRLEEGVGPGALVHRLRRDHASSRTTSRTSSTTPSPPGWRTSWTRSPAGPPSRSRG